MLLAAGRTRPRKKGGRRSRSRCSHHDFSGAHGAGWRDEQVIAAFTAPLHDRRAVEKRSAPPGCGQRKAADVLHRVQAEPCAEPDRSGGAAAAQVAVPLESNAVEEVDVPVAEHFAIDPHPLLQLSHRAGPMRDDEPAVGLRIAGDRLGGDQFANGFDRFDPDVDRTARRLEPPLSNPLLEPELPHRDECEPAVAPASAPAESLGLEHHGIEPVRAGQAKTRREAGVAAADNDKFARRSMASGKKDRRLRSGCLHPVGVGAGSPPGSQAPGGGDCERYLISHALNRSVSSG